MVGLHFHSRQSVNLLEGDSRLLLLDQGVLEIVTYLIGPQVRYAGWRADKASEDNSDGGHII